jgi:hypothetical protein
LKIGIVAKSFLRKQATAKKKNHKKNVWWKIAKSFPRKQVPTKNFHQKFLVENF